MATASPNHDLMIFAPASRPRGVVLVIHSWWGRTASFTRYGEAFAAEGFTAAVSDIYGGRTARTEAEVRALKSARRRQPVYRDLLRDVGTLCGATGAERIGVVGFSMGAHWAVWLSQQPANRVTTAVLYYGARGGGFAESRAAYLAHFAETDPWVSASSRRGMERALALAGRPYRALDYPGTGHWFAESDRADAYAPEAAALAFGATVAHLAECLA